MPFPLVWLGAAVVSAIAAHELNEQHKNSDLMRDKKSNLGSRGELNRHASGVEKYPSEVFSSNKFADIKPGALVCCGLGGVLEHTGILIDEQTIVELHGNGLVKAISPKRFLNERSGNEIFVACDAKKQAIASDLTAQRAIKQIFNYQEYDLIKNNCHRFAWQCISGKQEELTTFHQLNMLLSKQYDVKIYWDKWQRN
ncbi:lecithin retinol acyltransferase family protein [Colwelliaceae bacterium BS250]